MPPFIYFLVLLSVSLAAVIGLRLALLRTGRHIQKHVGLSDTALTEHSRPYHFFCGSRLVVVGSPVTSARAAMNSRPRRHAMCRFGSQSRPRLSADEERDSSYWAVTSEGLREGDGVGQPICRPLVAAVQFWAATPRSPEEPLCGHP